MPFPIWPRLDLCALNEVKGKMGGKDGRIFLRVVVFGFFFVKGTKISFFALGLRQGKS